MSGKRRRQQLHNDYEKRLAALQDRYDREIPNLRSQLNLLEGVLADTETLTDSTVNLVFKNKRLLKNSRKPDPKWPPERVERLKKQAKEHNNYLRRLKGKSAKKLDQLEIVEIRRFIDRTLPEVLYVESGREMADFLAETAPLMADYFQEQEELQKKRKLESDEKIRLKQQADQERKAKRKRAKELEQKVAPSSKAMNLLSIIKKEQDGGTVAQEVPTGASHQRGKKEANLITMVGVSDTQTRLNDIQSTYYRTVENPVIQPSLVEQGLVCPTCAVPRVIDMRLGTATCPECATSLDYDPFGKASIPFNEERNVTRVKQQNYERMSHFEDWLDKVSGNRVVPPEVFSMVFEECQRLGIKTLVDQRTRKLLGRLGRTDQYNNVITITRQFNGTPAAKFTENQRNTLKRMFKESQEPFEKCPWHIKQRTNFMSYSYFNNRCCHMRGWDQYLPCFPLPGGEDVCRRHDRMWKWMIDYHNEQGIGEEQWTFYRTT